MKNDAAVLEIASRVVADTPSERKFAIQAHTGENGHKAIRIYGCPIHEARGHCTTIALVLTPIIRQRGYPAVRVIGGEAMVWYR